MLESAVTSLGKLALRDKVRNDDGIDQLHHFVTVAILAFFAAVTGVVEYAGEPINCWNHGEQLWKHFQDHVNRYCWTQPLYHYPNESNRSQMPYSLTLLGAPQDESAVEAVPESDKVTFFRWVTIIFLVQAFLFKIPNLLWTELNTYSGSNIIKMVEMLDNILFSAQEEKQKKLKQVALFLEQWLTIHRKPGRWFLKSNVSPLMKKTMSVCMGCVGNNLDNYLSTSYLLIKALFLFNNLMQFLLLSAFLQLNFWHFGVETLKSYENMHTIYHTTSRTFPIVSLCHFQTYNKGASGYWVQCILTINIFQEKIFLIEWFWLLILLTLTFINFFIWCFRLLQTQTSLKFVERYMRLMQSYDTLERPEGSSVEQFVTQYLRSDGVFVLRILSVNTNEVVVAQLVEELWKRYLKFDEVAPQDGSFELKQYSSDTPFSQGDTPLSQGDGAGVDVQPGDADPNRL